MFFYFSRTINCDRFTTSENHNDITIRPTAKVQSVLGTNGSGKSSMLSVMFAVIPPKASSFIKRPGLWHNKLIHKGRDYELKATYGIKDKEKDTYAFIVDGENLNKGLNITKYLELAEEHFGYTPLIQKLHAGEIKFTQMSAAERKDWIARLSSVDFTFAFSEYKRFVKGATKSKDLCSWLQTRINEESEKLIQEDDVKAMQAKSLELKDLLEMLMREPKSEVRGPSSQDMDDKVANCIAQLDKFLTTEYPPVSDDGVSWQLQLELLNAELNEVRGALTVRAETLAETEQKLRRLEAMMANDPKELEATQKELTEALAKLPSASIDLHDSLIVRATEAVNKLRQWCADVPRVFVSADQGRALEEDAVVRNGKLNKVNALMDDLLRQVGHIENCQSVSCPACSHVFKPGISPTQLPELQKRIESGSEIQTKMRNEVEELNDNLMEATVSKQSHIKYQQLRHEYASRYPGLFAYIDQCGGFEIGKELLGKLAIYEREVSYLEDKAKLTERLKTVEAALTQYKQESGDYFEIKEQYKQAYDHYEQVAKAVGEVRHRRDLIRANVTHCTEYDRLAKDAEQCYEIVRSDLIQFCNTIGDDLIDQVIDSTLESIRVHDQALYEHDLTTMLIKDLTKQLGIAKIDAQAYTALAEAMNPKTGLIAEQITHQIGALIGAMNSMIKKVWNYPLYLCPVKAAEDGIDYKFPMVVKGKPRDDIDDGSSSIESIIDWAFVYVSYYCLNMAGYPLRLDELGRDFDEVHRVNLRRIVKEFSDNDYFSQIFMINHQLDALTSFPNSETIILDKTNIEYKHDYNLHVEFA